MEDKDLETIVYGVGSESMESMVDKEPLGIAQDLEDWTRIRKFYALTRRQRKVGSCSLLLGILFPSRPGKRPNLLRCCLGMFPFELLYCLFATH